MATEVRFEFEYLSPVEGMDRIYSDYSKTFGSYRDAFMAQVVAQTKEDLFIWWGAHRERIRAALVATCSAAGGVESRAPSVQPVADEREARNWNGWDEWETELTDFLSTLASRNDEIGRRAEGLGQFLPELRAAFSHRRTNGAQAAEGDRP